MTTATNPLLVDVNALVEAGELENQTEAQTGFKREVTPEGVTTARFVGYVEIGKQPQRAYEGQEKPDAEEVILTWELNGPAYMRNVAKKDEPEKLVPTIFRETITRSLNEKAKYFKLFTKMRGAQPVKHMAQLVGQGFLIQIKHKASKDGKSKYANIYTPVDGWMVNPPFETSAATGVTTEVPVPAADGPQQILLQDAPNEAQWNSIFIDGTFEKKDGDNTIELPRNFTQFKCIGASNFAGSKLEAVVGSNLAALQAGKALLDAAYVRKDAPAETKPDETAPTTAPTVETPPAQLETPAETAPEVAPEVPAETAPTDTPAADPLAALGLTT